MKISSGNTTLDSSTYGYNTAGQRTSFVNAAGASVQYTYDYIGQLYNALSSISGESRTYKTDAAWNTSPLSSNYVFDVKNELTNNGVNNLLFDANGNLTNNIVSYNYDDENRLTLASEDVQHTFRTGFAYDGLGRLRKRFDYTYGVPTAGPTGPFVLSTWYVTNTVLYVYDGWRVIQERDTNSNPEVSYTRGLDLSGTFEGAGGIGGLLAWSGQPGTFFYHADGNGNITCLIGGNQSVQATYRYDPYGNTTSSSGPMAAANTYRFSSKEAMSASGLYYYGYRFYVPTLERWLNRDPIQERGGFNLYRYVSSEPTDRIDPMGLIAVHDVSQFLQALGPFGGRCLNRSQQPEWALVGGAFSEDRWQLLQPGQSTSVFEDCDGMTCGGGFYKVKGGAPTGEAGACKTPGNDCPKYAARRWTPTNQGPQAESPTARGSPVGDTPPGYTYTR